jgi:hypothetical protein
MRSGRAADSGFTNHAVGSVLEAGARYTLCAVEVSLAARAVADSSDSPEEDDPPIENRTGQKQQASRRTAARAHRAQAGDGWLLTGIGSRGIAIVLSR